MNGSLLSRVRSHVSNVRWKRKIKRSEQYVRHIQEQQFIFKGEEFRRIEAYLGEMAPAGVRNERSMRHDANRQQRSGTAAVKTDVPAAPVLSKAGIRSTAGWKLLLGVFLTLSCVLLFKVGTINALQQDTIAREQTRNELKSEHVMLSDTLTHWQESAQVGYEAVKLGMVDSNGVKRVVISLP